MGISSNPEEMVAPADRDCAASGRGIAGFCTDLGACAVHLHFVLRGLYLAKE